ncbi:unnamed protein product [Adineta ricciae]|uniref:Serine aminopeptidase S33 domain-containing protein n=1 Tax=Adineta ricciae TaxID=249248 RepID=A0A815NJR6_ADIRI|nr:unnamed protein product [Adineta ricciae]
MSLLIIIFIVGSVGLIYKFRDRLGFLSGRLSRQLNSKSSSALTSMDSDEFIELSFGKVHYIYRSSIDPSSTLNVFVHGFSIPMEIWQDVFQSLSNDNQSCLIFDLYGRGWSDAPDVPMNVDLFVSQLVELLFALKLSHEKYNLFGVSMGGYIVQRFTELYPSRVSKLVLCCSAGLNNPKPSPVLLSILSVPVLGPALFKLVMQRGDSDKIRSQWAYPGSDKYKQYVDLFLKACKHHPGYLRSLLSTILYFDFDSALNSIQTVNKLNIPILIIWGDKDTLIPVENGYRYHQLYKNSSLTIVPGANHSLLIEHSNEAIRAIKPFLNEKN